ncbi:hypothetical protein [Acinetobacter equi]|nr:hypothetical protein [Acinetobacter equi]
MKKLLQDVLAPVCLFSIGILLIGCDQSKVSSLQESENTSIEAAENKSETSEFRSGNMFYIIRDVADFQMSSNDYIEQLQHTKYELQTALQNKDQSLLTTSVENLKQQLTTFNDALAKLELKSEEINNIRKQLIQTNEQALKSSYLNGQHNFSEQDFKNFEQQLGNIQTEMLKLAQMVMNNSQEPSSNEAEN